VALKAAGVVPQTFVILDLPDLALIEKSLHRRMDPTTGTIYHLTEAPPPDSETLERLVHRPDDTLDAIESKLEEYHHNVEAVASVYSTVLRSVWDAQLFPISARSYIPSGAIIQDY
jgi:adenylate kinase